MNPLRTGRRYLSTSGPVGVFLTIPTNGAEGRKITPSFKLKTTLRMKKHSPKSYSQYILQSIDIFLQVTTQLLKENTPKTNPISTYFYTIHRVCSKHKTVIRGKPHLLTSRIRLKPVSQNRIMGNLPHDGFILSE